jgi:hypothetical protein
LVRISRPDSAEDGEDLSQAAPLLLVRSLRDPALELRDQPIVDLVGGARRPRGGGALKALLGQAAVRGSGGLHDFDRRDEEARIDELGQDASRSFGSFPSWAFTIC